MQSRRHVLCTPAIETYMSILSSVLLCGNSAVVMCRDQLCYSVLLADVGIYAYLALKGKVLACHWGLKLGLASWSRQVLELVER